MNGKTIIYYFSGTGNNLWIALTLKKQLGDAAVVPMHRLKGQNRIPAEYEWVVFCVPSYYSHIPAFVTECLKGITFQNQQKVVTIIGCGGNRGMAIQDVRQCVQDSGYQVQQEYMVVMPGNYIISYGAFPKVYQSICRHRAKRQLRGIARRIKAGEVHLCAKPGIFYKESQEERFHKAMNEFGVIGKEYTVSPDCVACGTCVNVCPVHNITLKDGKVEFGEACAQCMACIQWCPKQAIDYQGKTKSRKHYHHSDITLQKMIQQNKRED